MPALLSKGHGAHSPPAAVAVDAPAAQHSRFGRSKSRRNKSSLSGIKIDLHESHAEKEARRLKSYADPNMAVQGLEPAAAALEQATIDSLSMRQHKDIWGNPIADPDLSNPTRHRQERPLDTIRSFEAAIEESYHTKRASYGSRGEHGSNYDHRPSSSTGDDEDMPSGAVQAPYGYPHSGSRRHLVPPPEYAAPPTSQAGLAWVNAPAAVAPPRRPIVSGPDEKKGWFRRRLGKSR